MIPGEKMGGPWLSPRAVRVPRDVCRVALAHLAVAHLVVGCVSTGSVRGSPLYPGAPLPPAQVATLTGYVAEVDGQDVTPLLPPFELLPGCHVVFTPEQWGSVGPTSTVTSQTGKWAFALPMLAGHFYEIKVIAGEQTAISGTIQIKGIESDAAGDQTRVFEHITNPTELDACRKGEASAGGR
jgi:hypothetical protein